MKFRFLALSLLFLSACSSGLVEEAESSQSEAACHLAKEFLSYKRGGDEVLSEYDCVIDDRFSSEDTGQVGLYFQPNEKITDIYAKQLFEREMEQYDKIPLSFVMAVIVEKNLIFTANDRRIYLYAEDENTFSEVDTEELKKLFELELPSESSH